MAVSELADDMRAQFPHTLELLIPYIEATEAGFPTRTEMERINKVEDGFSCGNHSIRLVGVMTGGSCSRFVFCYNGTDEDAVIQTLMGANANIEYHQQVFKDDNFGYYDNMIAPSVYDHNYIMNRNVYSNLEKHGETFKEPRDIDFFCYFASTQHIQNIADKLSAQGFREADRHETEDGQHSLHLVKEGIPTLPWINEVTTEIIDLLENTDGYFDGWGSPALK